MRTIDEVRAEYARALDWWEYFSEVTTDKWNDEDLDEARDRVVELADELDALQEHARG